MTMTEVETESIEKELNALRVEHRDLDDAIAKLANDWGMDEFRYQRLKKRKLALKDKIARLEGRLPRTLHS